MTGRWVFVVGPSGAGKDSVLGWVRQALAAHASQGDIVLACRLETRAGPANSAARRTLSSVEMSRLLRADALAFHWQAHGFDYAIGTAYARDVQAGRQVLVNGSRAHVAQMQSGAQARAQALPASVVLVTAAPAVRAARLAARGREAQGAIDARLARAEQALHARPDCVIENNQTLAQAGEALLRFLRRAD